VGHPPVDRPGTGGSDGVDRHPRRAALPKIQVLVFERFLMTDGLFAGSGTSVLKKIIFITGKFP
jgi:hypothetical protein